MTKTRLPLLKFVEDNRRLNRTPNYPGQDRALETMGICFSTTTRRATRTLTLFNRAQATMNRMMSLVHRATEMSLEYISQPDALGASAEEVKLQSTDFAMMDDDFDGDDDGSSELAPMAQIITSACWLTVKEGSLLTGDAMDSSATTKIFSPDEITDAGARLMRVLFSVKHTGALAKTRIAMTALCSRLLRSGDDALTSLPQRWLDEVAERLNRPGQDFRDRVRRSAGLPYAFIAILLAEPKNQPRTALADALPRLLDVASGRTSSSDIPRVHAFNVIRVVFADRDLAHDTTPYAARGVEICIDAFSAPTWEVRRDVTCAHTLIRSFLLRLRWRYRCPRFERLRLGARLVPQQHQQSSDEERARIIRVRSDIWTRHVFVSSRVRSTDASFVCFFQHPRRLKTRRHSRTPRCSPRCADT